MASCYKCLLHTLSTAEAALDRATQQQRPTASKPGMASKEPSPLCWQNQPGHDDLSLLSCLMVKERRKADTSVGKPAGIQKNVAAAQQRILCFLHCLQASTSNSSVLQPKPSAHFSASGVVAPDCPDSRMSRSSPCCCWVAALDALQLLVSLPNVGCGATDAEL